MHGSKGAAVAEMHVLAVGRGTWKDVEFKEYNFNALGLPTNGGHLHPLLKVRNIPLSCSYSQSSTISTSCCCLRLRPASRGSMLSHGRCTVQVRAQIRKAFTSMGFQEMPTNNYVESRSGPCALLLTPMQCRHMPPFSANQLTSCALSPDPACFWRPQLLEL